jgi:hypothetical protein
MISGTPIGDAAALQKFSLRFAHCDAAMAQCAIQFTYIIAIRVLKITIAMRCAQNGKNGIMDPIGSHCSL